MKVVAGHDKVRNVYSICEKIGERVVLQCYFLFLSCVRLLTSNSTFLSLF